MELKKDIKNLEQLFHTDLHQYLLSIGKVDERLPEAPDIEELWQKIGESYLPDGMREFNAYPTVSLGWMMFIGMAIAKYWDTDWELYSKVGDLYKYLRDQRDFDHMDDYICEKVLLLADEDHALMTKIGANVPHAHKPALPPAPRARHSRGFPGLCVCPPPDVSHGHVDGTETPRLPHDEAELTGTGHGALFSGKTSANVKILP